MKNICLIIIFILIISVIILVIYTNDSIMVNKSNTSIQVNIMRAIFIEKEKINGTLKEDNTKFGNKIKKKVKCHIPKFMLELYENNKTGFNTSSPDVVRSVVPKRADSFNGKNLVENFLDSHLLIFDLPKTNNDEIFIYAELKILTLIEKEDESTFGIEKKISLSVYDESLLKFINIHELHIYHSNDTWLSFNLTDQVEEILENESNTKNLKIIITISSLVSVHFEERNNLKLSLLPSKEDSLEHEYPILLLSYVSNPNHHQEHNLKNGNERIKTRKKRFIDEDYEEETNRIWDELTSKKTYERKIKRIKNICKRKPLYIDFAEINYDEWIVQPSGYEAFQCQGKCFYPVADHLSPTKHAIMQALLHSVAPSRATRACCVPTSLDSISILYVDDDGVLTYRYAYRDMVVLECGCR